MDRRHDDGEPPFNGCREANTVLKEGDRDRHRRLSRDSPDDSRTGVNSSAFPAFLKDGVKCRLRPAPRAARTVVGGLIWPFSPTLGRTPHVCAARRLTPALVATAAVVPRSAAKPPGHLLCVLNWLPYAGGTSHAPDCTAAPSGASAISHDRPRYAFDHVICANADALQARPPSNGRKVFSQPHQLPSHLLFQRSSRLTDVPR